MKICMQFSSGISSLIILIITLYFPLLCLQLPHSTSSLQHLRGVCWGVTRSRADDLKSSAGVCKVQLFARSQCDGLTGAILGCFVSCHSFISTN